MLTFKEKWMKFWGFGYKANRISKEIHRLKYRHVSCHTNLMTNYKFVTRRKALKLLKNGYDGCRYCWKEMDNG